MYFVTIPNDGSSWQQPLIYCFANEEGEPTDVLVEIIDESRDKIIATKRLYGVVEAEVDIAPYLSSLSRQSVVISGVSAIRDSKLARSISVSINGTKSSSRLFVHSSFDVSQPKLLSRLDGQLQVERGDALIFTMFVPSEVRIMITEFSPGGVATHKLTWSDENSVVDVVVQTSALSSQATYFTLDIYTGSMLFKSMKFTIVEPNAQSRKLVWRNALGGVEGYTFPHNIRIESGVITKSFATTKERISKLYDASHRSRLSSAYESPKELERIAEVMLSHHVYENVDGLLREVRLEDRQLDYSSHGRLHQVCLNLIDEWRGGEV
jgi:hypothetical protein